MPPLPPRPKSPSQGAPGSGSPGGINPIDRKRKSKFPDYTLCSVTTQKTAYVSNTPDIKILIPMCLLYRVTDLDQWQTLLDTGAQG